MSDFAFADMAGHFDAHIAAHLPGYADVQDLVATVATHVVPDGGVIADIGCSTGTTIESIHNRLASRSIDYVGYDLDEAMIDTARARVPYARVFRTDVTSTQGLKHRDADLTTLLWTLQFIRAEKRDQLLTRLRRRANPHGVILIAAKTRIADSRWEDIAISALDHYKESQGVSAQERIDKTRGLRGVLMAETAEETARRLIRADFHSPTLLFRWHVWSVIAAYASSASVRDEVLM